MANQQPRRVALGVDHGTRRTGFAAADASRILVTPLDPVQGGDAEALDAIAALCEERDVGVLVVGYPLHMDGAAGPRVAEVDAFIARAEERFPELGVVRQDERLTTREAEERLREAGYHGAQRKARKDSWSAMILLEDWIGAGEPR